MIVVSDTSPILNLARIGRLELLASLYGQVLNIDRWDNILADAKRAGLIKLVKPVLDDLIQNARFWIGHELYREVLAELGEA